jgi:hypothetical protein
MARRNSRRSAWISPGAWVLSKYKATREAIELLGCELIEGTDEQVPASELLPDGRFMPQ